MTVDLDELERCQRRDWDSRNFSAELCAYVTFAREELKSARARISELEPLLGALEYHRDRAEELRKLLADSNRDNAAYKARVSELEKAAEEPRAKLGRWLAGASSDTRSWLPCESDPDGPTFPDKWCVWLQEFGKPGIDRFGPTEDEAIAAALSKLKETET